MKKQYFLAIAMFMLLTVFAACSSDDNLDNGKGKVDVASTFEFPVTFADYNSDVQVGNTRAAANSSDTLKHEFVNMGNGLVADVTLQRDKENLSGNPVQAASTRTLTNDSYTMLAYQSGVLKGELKGFISSGSFIPNAGDPTAMSLAPGNYDFVLYSTSYFTRSGNSLRPTSANEYAILGRTNYTVTATPQKQKVPFAMKHTAARVRVKFNTYIKVPQSNFSVNFSATNPTEVPSSAVYDAATGTWSTSGTGGAFSFGGSSAWTESLGSGVYSYTSPDYSYIFPGSNITNLNANFSYGRIYTEDLNGKSLTFALTPVLASVANGSYLISITFHYNFLYLMTDGTTGLFSETTFGGGTKTPIAVVISQSKQLAAALEKTSYSGSSYYSGQVNNNVVNVPSFIPWTGTGVFSSDGADGYKFTWEASGSADGTTIKANEQTRFPAFYSAAHYTPTLPSGKTLTGSIVGKKWFLPSLGEVLKIYPALKDLDTSAGFYARDMGGGMIDNTYWQLGMYSPLTPSGMASMAFSQVNGVPLGGGLMITSSQSDTGQPIMANYWIEIGAYSGEVRPFIHY
ncbi:MAG: fimbrillin family protein [Prevotella melaninogenica]